MLILYHLGLEMVSFFILRTSESHMFFLELWIFMYSSIHLTRFIELFLFIQIVGLKVQKQKAWLLPMKNSQSSVENYIVNR